MPLQKVVFHIVQFPALTSWTSQNCPKLVCSRKVGVEGVMMLLEEVELLLVRLTRLKNKRAAKGEDETAGDLLAGPISQS